MKPSTIEKKARHFMHWREEQGGAVRFMDRRESGAAGNIAQRRTGAFVDGVAGMSSEFASVDRMFEFNASRGLSRRQWPREA